MAIKIDSADTRSIEEKMQDILDSMPPLEEVVNEILGENPAVMDDIPLAIMIDYAYDQKAVVAEIQKKANEQKRALDTMMASIMQMMDDEGNLKFAGGLKGKCAITEEDVPSVEDWDKVFEYIRENDAFELLERRIKSGAWRALQMTDPVPGTAPHTKRTLSLTKVPVSVTRKKK